LLAVLVPALPAAAITCYGDSGGPNFLGDTNVIAAITITGDAVCRATNVDYRLDTESARSFLGQYVAVP
jgi:hypothetical protein